MILDLVRHGETDYNLSRCLQGRLDTDLNDRGIEQALRLAEELEGLGIEMIYTSPLKRAVKTAEIVRERLQCPIQTDSRLLERDFGQFSDRPYAELDLMGLSWDTVDFLYPEAGVEPLDHLTERVESFLRDLREAPFRHVLVVGHGATSRIFCHILLGERYDPLQDVMKNGSRIRFEMV